MIKLTHEEFTLLYSFLHSHGRYPQSELEAVLMAQDLFNYLDLRNHFGGHFCDIDERMYHSFIRLKFSVTGCDVVSQIVLNFSDDIIIYSSNKGLFSDNLKNGVIETVKFINNLK